MTVDLAFERKGEGPLLVVLHGLLGSGRNWASLAKRFAAAHTVLTADARNHGRSPWDPAMSYLDQAADVAALIEAQDAGPAAVMGHSMGGKTAMALALTRPELVERLIVADISPVPHDRARFGDYIRAMREIDLDAVTRRGDADRQLAEVEPDPAVRGFLLLNLASEQGRFFWRPNLEGLLAAMTDVLDWPGELDGRRYEGPALVVKGGASPYVRPEHEAAFRSHFPACRIETVPGAGHWVHAEAPDAYFEVVDRFLREAG